MTGTAEMDGSGRRGRGGSALLTSGGPDTAKPSGDRPKTKRRSKPFGNQVKGYSRRLMPRHVIWLYEANATLFMVALGAIFSTQVTFLMSCVEDVNNYFTPFIPYDVKEADIEAFCRWSIGSHLLPPITFCLLTGRPKHWISLIVVALSMTASIIFTAVTGDTYSSIHPVGLYQSAQNALVALMAVVSAFGFRQLLERSQRQRFEQQVTRQLKVWWLIEEKRSLKRYVDALLPPSVRSRLIHGKVLAGAEPDHGLVSHPLHVASTGPSDRKTSPPPVPSVELTSSASLSQNTTAASLRRKPSGQKAVAFADEASTSQKLLPVTYKEKGSDRASNSGNTYTTSEKARTRSGSGQLSSRNMHLTPTDASEGGVSDNGKISLPLTAKAGSGDLALLDGSGDERQRRGLVRRRDQLSLGEAFAAPPQFTDPAMHHVLHHHKVASVDPDHERTEEEQRMGLAIANPRPAFGFGRRNAILDHTRCGTVVVVDIYDFVPYCQRRLVGESVVAVAMLHAELKSAASRCKLDHCVTFGDTFVAVSNLFRPQELHAALSVRFVHEAFAALYPPAAASPPQLFEPQQQQQQQAFAINMPPPEQYQHFSPPYPCPTPPPSNYAANGGAPLPMGFEAAIASPTVDNQLMSPAPLLPLPAPPSVSPSTQAPHQQHHHPQQQQQQGTSQRSHQGTEMPQVRVALHTGPISGGVVGHAQLRYAIFGPTVSTAVENIIGLCGVDECYVMISETTVVALGALAKVHDASPIALEIDPSRMPPSELLLKRVAEQVEKGRGEEKEEIHPYDTVGGCFDGNAPLYLHHHDLHQQHIHAGGHDPDEHDDAFYGADAFAYAEQDQLGQQHHTAGPYEMAIVGTQREGGSTPTATVAVAVELEGVGEVTIAATQAPLYYAFEDGTVAYGYVNYDDYGTPFVFAADGAAAAVYIIGETCVVDETGMVTIDSANAIAGMNDPAGEVVGAAEAVAAGGGDVELANYGLSPVETSPSSHPPLTTVATPASVCYPPPSIQSDPQHNDYSALPFGTGVEEGDPQKVDEGGNHTKAAAKSPPTAATAERRPPVTEDRGGYGFVSSSSSSSSSSEGEDEGAAATAAMPPTLYVFTCVELFESEELNAALKAEDGIVFSPSARGEHGSPNINTKKKKTRGKWWRRSTAVCNNKRTNKDKEGESDSRSTVGSVFVAKPLNGECSGSSSDESSDGQYNSSSSSSSSSGSSFSTTSTSTSTSPSSTASSRSTSQSHNRKISKIGSGSTTGDAKIQNIKTTMRKTRSTRRRGGATDLSSRKRDKLACDEEVIITETTIISNDKEMREVTTGNSTLLKKEGDVSRKTAMAESDGDGLKARKRPSLCRTTREREEEWARGSRVCTTEKWRKRANSASSSNSETLQDAGNSTRNNRKNGENHSNDEINKNSSTSHVTKHVDEDDAAIAIELEEMRADAIVPEQVSPELTAKILTRQREMVLRQTGGHRWLFRLDNRFTNEQISRAFYVYHYSHARYYGHIMSNILAFFLFLFCIVVMIVERGGLADVIADNVDAHFWDCDVLIGCPDISPHGNAFGKAMSGGLFLAAMLLTFLSLTIQICVRDTVSRRLTVLAKVKANTRVAGGPMGGLMPSTPPISNPSSPVGAHPSVHVMKGGKRGTSNSPQKPHQLTHEGGIGPRMAEPSPSSPAASFFSTIGSTLPSRSLLECCGGGSGGGGGGGGCLSEKALARIRRHTEMPHFEVSLSHDFAEVFGRLFHAAVYIDRFILPYLIVTAGIFGGSLSHPSVVGNSPIFILEVLVIYLQFSPAPAWAAPFNYTFIFIMFLLSVGIVHGVSRWAFIITNLACVIASALVSLGSTNLTLVNFAQFLSLAMHKDALDAHRQVRQAVLAATVPAPLQEEFAKLRSAISGDRLFRGEAAIGTILVQDMVLAEIRTNGLRTPTMANALRLGGEEATSTAVSLLTFCQRQIGKALAISNKRTTDVLTRYMLERAQKKADAAYQQRLEQYQTTIANEHHAVLKINAAAAADERSSPSPYPNLPHSYPSHPPLPQPPSPYDVAASVFGHPRLKKSHWLSITRFFGDTFTLAGPIACDEPQAHREEVVLCLIIFLRTLAILQRENEYRRSSTAPSEVQKTKKNQISRRRGGRSDTKEKALTTNSSSTFVVDASAEEREGQLKKMETLHPESSSSMHRAHQSNSARGMLMPVSSYAGGRALPAANGDSPKGYISVDRQSGSLSLSRSADGKVVAAAVSGATDGVTSSDTNRNTVINSPDVFFSGAVGSQLSASAFPSSQLAEDNLRGVERKGVGGGKKKNEGEEARSSPIGPLPTTKSEAQTHYDEEAGARNKDQPRKEGPKRGTSKKTNYKMTSTTQGNSGAAFGPLTMRGVIKRHPIVYTAAAVCDIGITVMHNSLYPSFDVLGNAAYRASLLLRAAPTGALVVTEPIAKIYCFSDLVTMAIRIEAERVVNLRRYVSGRGLDTPPPASHHGTSIITSGGGGTSTKAGSRRGLLPKDVSHLHYLPRRSKSYEERLSSGMGAREGLLQTHTEEKEVCISKKREAQSMPTSPALRAKHTPLTEDPVARSASTPSSVTATTSSAAGSVLLDEDVMSTEDCTSLGGGGQRRRTGVESRNLLSSLGRDGLGGDEQPSVVDPLLAAATAAMAPSLLAGNATTGIGGIFEPARVWRVRGLGSVTVHQLRAVQW